MNQHEELWEEYWKPLLCDDEESIDMSRLKAELYDAYQLAKEVSKVYKHITKGKLNSCYYKSDEVIAIVDDMVFKEGKCILIQCI